MEAPVRLRGYEWFILQDIIKQTVSYGKQYHKQLPYDPKEYPSNLLRSCGCFSTIEYHGKIDRTVGLLESNQPLLSDVIHNTYRVTFAQCQTTANVSAHSKALVIGLSIVQSHEPIYFKSEAELLAQIIANDGGYLLKEKASAGILLPEDWKTYETPEAYLHQLKRNAKLPDNYWSTHIDVTRFYTQYATVSVSIDQNSERKKIKA